MTQAPVVLITGANGEIGRALLQRLHAEGRYKVVTLDLTPLPDHAKPYCLESYAGNILDRNLLDQIAAHHELDAVFHLAALLSTRGERDPELAHQINVEGTLHLLRMAQQQTDRLGRPVRFLFPSSVAVYGLADLATKAAAGAVREEEHNEPITMYGCNKLYCEQLGSYYSHNYQQLAETTPVMLDDFRAIRFPGLISAFTLPSGGTSDFAPEMIHAAAQGEPYRCFVRPETRIPFMAMPDAIKALLQLASAPVERLTRHVYNVTSFNPSAEEVAEIVLMAFPNAEITFAPDMRRQSIVDTWPAQVDDQQARLDWGWQPDYDLANAFDQYLIPNIRERYTTT